MKKTMMIDYRDAKDQIRRKEIDDMEFCIRRGEMFFVSDGKRYHISLESVIQIYLN